MIFRSDNSFVQCKRTMDRIIYIVGSKSFRPDQLFKVTEIKTTLLFFNIVSLYFNTLFNWHINLTINGTVYPSQHFPFGAAFVCQAGNFWTLLRILLPFGVNPETLFICPSSSCFLRASRTVWVVSDCTPCQWMLFLCGPNDLSLVLVHPHVFSYICNSRALSDTKIYLLVSSCSKVY